LPCTNRIGGASAGLDATGAVCAHARTPKSGSPNEPASRGKVPALFRINRRDGRI
jgi:hypothetical protein